MAQGFFIVPHAFILERLHEVSGCELKVYLALRSWADRDGYCFPSVESIAERAGISTSTAKAALRRLQELAWIRIEISGRKGSVTRHGYRILAGMKIGPVPSNHRDENQPGDSSATGTKSDPVNTPTGPKFEHSPGRKSSLHRAENRPLTITNKQEPEEQDFYLRAELAGSQSRLLSVPRTRPEEGFSDAWNRLRGPLPRVSKLSESRRRKVKARMSEGITLDSFEKAVRKCSSTPFLSGVKGGWRATFDWLIENDTNLSKVLEGNYDDNHTGGNGNGSGGHRQHASTKASRTLDALRDALTSVDHGQTDTPSTGAPSGSVARDAALVLVGTRPLPRA